MTKEAFVETGNGDVATASPKGGLLTAARRGEAPILARYEGAYAATTLTVMGDRTGFQWEDPPTFNKVDELTAAKWQRMKIRPSELCSDAEFLRRVTLDLTGLPPSADQVRAFLADDRPTREKRDALVDRLVGSEEYVEYWTNKWADLLQVNRKFLGTEGSVAFRKWVREEVRANTPYDEFVRKILTADGSTKDNPAASYFKILREPEGTMENTTHLFLAVRFNCNKCHDHPFEKWTQDQYYNLAAYFAQVGLKPDPKGGDKKIGGTAVEGAKPLYEVVFDRTDGDVKHDRTGEVAPPTFPYKTPFTLGKGDDRRDQLAAWLTAPENPYFAKSYVNRLWGYMFGTGIIDPIDDIRAGNPATNPALLDYLTDEFVKSGFDARHVIKLICKSRTYQLSVATNKWNADDKTNFSHAVARRLPAEVLYDTVHRVVGSVTKIPGVPPGTRAAELPDSGIDLPTGFLGELGRPVRESACECERTAGLQLGPVMALVNGQTIAGAINDPNNDLAKLVAAENGRHQTRHRTVPPHPQPRADPGRGRPVPGRPQGPGRGPRRAGESDDGPRGRGRRHPGEAGEGTDGRDRRGPGRPRRPRDGDRPGRRRRREGAGRQDHRGRGGPEGVRRQDPGETRGPRKGQRRRPGMGHADADELQGCQGDHVHPAGRRVGVRRGARTVRGRTRSPPRPT